MGSKENKKKACITTGKKVYSKIYHQHNAQRAHNQKSSIKQLTV